MNTLSKTILFFIIITVLSCNSKTKKTISENLVKKDAVVQKSTPTKAELLLAEAVNAHGGKLYDTAHIGFRFRDKSYTFQNGRDSYFYTVSSIKDNDTIYDVLANGTLIRAINGQAINLSEKDNAKYTEALNSVIYFATLPHKLQDKAVNKTYEGAATVKGEAYELLGVTFNQDGGGKDYSDTFLYWIHKKTKFIDYLAYSYSTNDGGVRFRSALNPRNVNGIRFQDYINYEAPMGTPLKELPSMFEKGDLKELSKILTEEVHAIM